MKMKLNRKRRGTRYYSVKMSLDGVIKDDDIVIEPHKNYRFCTRYLDSQQRHYEKRGIPVLRKHNSITTMDKTFCVYFVEEKEQHEI